MNIDYRMVLNSTHPSGKKRSLGIRLVCFIVSCCRARVCVAAAGAFAGVGCDGALDGGGTLRRRRPRLRCS